MLSFETRAKNWANLSLSTDQKISPVLPSIEPALSFSCIYCPKMRLPYTSNPPHFTSLEDQAILSAVQSRRGEHGLIALDLALLHAPQIAGGWNSLLDAIRSKSSLRATLREIAICRTALINRAWYEWNGHAPVLAAAPEGFSEAKMAVVKQLHPTGKGTLDDEEWLVLRYADAMTANVKVPSGLADEVRRRFGVKQVIEITATIASYNMVGRFLVALDIGEQNDRTPEWASNATTNKDVVD